MRHKILSFCLIICLLFAMSGTVFAQEIQTNKSGSISITLEEKNNKVPIIGAELSIYYVASAEFDARGQLIYSYTDTFKSCGIALNDPSLTAKLDVYVSEHPILAIELITDSKGKVFLEEIPLGLYLVKQVGNVDGFSPCAPFLIKLPDDTTGEYIYNVNAVPKTDLEKLTDITVKKVWNVDENEKIPEAITVQLLKNGTAIQTIVLNKQNDWQVTLYDMPESDAYSIIEVDVPNGFTATYSQNGYKFVVTNTASLIQTGQLMWPVPVLAMTGLVLIAIGTVVLRKSGDDYA